jgi:pimeloyl-ACP methyl ester carboxylesterase
VEGLKAIPIGSLQNRNDADKILSDYVPESDVRQFLLKNLYRKPEGGFSWRINLPVIDKNLQNTGADVLFPGPFKNPVLFVRGAKSAYVKDDDRDRIILLFPNATLVTMETGHWVQAEKPKEFVEVVLNFLTHTT